MKLMPGMLVLTILIVVLLLTALRYFKKWRSEGSAPLLEQALAPAGRGPAARSSVAVPFDAAYWAQINDWQVKEQADDRRPMFGNIAKGTGSASAHRADVRRSLQVMYKKWSAAERD
jgi:hypothetical protein